MMVSISGCSPRAVAGRMVANISSMIGRINNIGPARRTIRNSPQTAGAMGLRLMTPKPEKAASVMFSLAKIASPGIVMRRDSNIEDD